MYLYGKNLQNLCHTTLSVNPLRSARLSVRCVRSPFCGRSVLSPTERPSHLPRKGLLRKGRVSSPCPSCHPPSTGAHAGLRPPVIPTAPPQHPANRFYPNRLWHQVPDFTPPAVSSWGGSAAKRSNLPIIHHINGDYSRQVPPLLSITLRLQVSRLESPWHPCPEEGQRQTSKKKPMCRRITPAPQHWGNKKKVNYVSFLSIHTFKSTTSTNTLL